MHRNEQLFLAGIKESEGGRYTDGVHPYDPGGPTKWGITIPDIPGATADTIKALTWDAPPSPAAAPIYRRRYWTGPRFAELPSGIDYTVADYGVNSGTSRAAKVLQRVVGVKEDGRVGRVTLDAVNKRDASAIIDAVNDERMTFLRSLKIWPTYKNGWTTRVLKVRSVSHRLAVAPLASVQLPAVPKGKHAEPEAVRKVVKASVPTAAAEEAARNGASWLDWIVAHPVGTAVAAVFVALAVFATLKAVAAWHKRRSEAPMPGTAVVPERPK